MAARAAQPFRLLVSGFEPFGSSPVNPSQEVVNALASERDAWLADAMVLDTCVLPVDARRGPRMLVRVIDDLRPQAVVCLGESARARAITLERVFVNLADYRIADNAGNQLIEQPIVRGGPAAYFSTLPLQVMREVVMEAGTPVEYSLSAGTYLCNHVAYAALHHARRRRLAAGFVHLPRLPEQVKGSDAPCMPLATVVGAVRAMLWAIAALRDRPSSRARSRKSQSPA